MSESIQILTARIGNQLIGLDIHYVNDIIILNDVSSVPLTSAEILGIINLRGQIVTVVDMLRFIGRSAESEQPETGDNIGTSSGAASHYKYGIVMSRDEHFYSLSVDGIGDVLEFVTQECEDVPPTLDENWKNYARSIVKLDGELMVLIDTEKVMDRIIGDHRAASTGSSSTGSSSNGTSGKNKKINEVA